MGMVCQVLYQHPLNQRDDYQPGHNFDASIGVHYDNLRELYNRYHFCSL